VTREGRVKVLDFGLAKGAPPTTDDSEGLTVGAFSSPGHVAGTAPYMAPEQIRGEDVDARTDLFAFGILLYELLTGQRPFAAPTTMALCAAILHEAPAPLAPARADLPPDVGRIVNRCLEKDPRERIQTALDVSHELRQVRKSLEAVHASRSTSEKSASIAVLPFANRSASADDEYFSDGLADELLNVLARIKGLRVTARSSAFTFKGKQATAAEIGRALNVATLLDGSVRKSGSRIRVSVQLVDVADSSHLWSETYDRTLEDIFAVQDDIAQSVVKELRTTLLGEEADSDASGAVKVDVAQAAKGRGTDPEAHRLLLLARHLLNRFTREDVSKATGYLKEALARDPEYALAWAELGRAQSMEADLHHVPPSEGYARAREATKRALALAPDLPEGLAVMAWIQLVCDLDYRGAEASYARALELAPGSANVLRGACAMASALGRHEEAIDLARRALEQDPLSAPSYHNLGAALDAADRLEESEAALRKELELAPQGRATLSLALLALGRGEEALEEAVREQDEPFRLWALAVIHHALGHPPESEAALEDLVEKYAGDSAFQIAEIRAARGEVNPAFEWLERAYAQRDPGLGALKISRRLRPLHDDPRWGVLLRKLGLAGTGASE
jgi:TolB-like protein/Tfp pilus assembly protein PilF